MTRARCLLACLVVVRAGLGGHASGAAEQLPSCGSASESRIASVLALRNWPGRPDALDSEPLVDRLTAQARCQDWVLFQAGYANRLPDWLALNSTSGEVRRYSELNRQDVEDDLLGLRRPPAYALDAARWGNPASHDFAHQFEIARYLLDPPDFFADAQAGSLRVYGLPAVSPAFGLHFESGHGANSIDLPGSVMFWYINADGSVLLRLTMSDWLFGRDQVSLANIDLPEPIPTAYDALRGDLVAPEGSRLVARDIVIDGRRFEGAVFEFAEYPYQPSFLFRTPELTLHGQVSGMTTDDLMATLAQLVALKEHPEVADAMRADADARISRQQPLGPPPYKLGDHPVSALTKLRAVQGDLVARYPGASLSNLSAAGDTLAADGTARLWIISISSLPDATGATIRIRIARPGP